MALPISQVILNLVYSLPGKQKVDFQDNCVTCGCEQKMKNALSDNSLRVTIIITGQILFFFSVDVAVPVLVELFGFFFIRGSLIFEPHPCAQYLIWVPCS